MKHGYLSYPRSIEVLPEGRLLIADTNHNRIVACDLADELRWELATIDGGTPRLMHWPRCARPTQDGGYVVVDSLMFRLLFFDAQLRYTGELSEFRWNGVAFKTEDMHDVRVLPNGNLLVVESDLNCVSRDRPKRAGRLAVRSRRRRATVERPPGPSSRTEVAGWSDVA